MISGVNFPSTTILLEEFLAVIIAYLSAFGITFFKLSIDSKLCGQKFDWMNRDETEIKPSNQKNLVGR